MGGARRQLTFAAGLQQRIILHAPTFRSGAGHDIEEAVPQIHTGVLRR
jgi:hypothetical protein